MTFRMGWMVGGWRSTPRSRRIGTNPCGPHFLGFPDVEHFDLPVRLDHNVFEASGGSAATGRIEPADRLVVLLPA
jgi:hypothetical protein